MRVSAILAFRFVTRAPERLAAFYTGLGFTAGEPEPIAADEMALLGLAGGGTRLPLRLGDQRLDLDGFDTPGAPYPADNDGADTRFQHIAIVTDDAATAWARAEALGATPISRGGPVTLPATSGDVTAVKLRDPEGHPLEFLQFPPGASDWTGRGLLGIDHSAISVADVAASRAFYEDLGLAVDGPTLNQGPTQQALDGLDGATVDVVPLRPHLPTPHLELLGYRTPAPRRASPQPADAVAATRIVWAAEAPALLRDPDGHLHQLTPAEGFPA